MCACVRVHVHVCVCVRVCACVYVHAVQNWRVKQLANFLTKKWCAERCDKELQRCTVERAFGDDCLVWCTNWRCNQVQEEEEQTEKEAKKIDPFSVGLVVVSLCGEMYTLFTICTWLGGKNPNLDEREQEELTLRKQEEGLDRQLDKERRDYAAEPTTEGKESEWQSQWSAWNSKISDHKSTMRIYEEELHDHEFRTERLKEELREAQERIEREMKVKWNVDHSVDLLAVKRQRKRLLKNAPTAAACHFRIAMTRTYTWITPWMPHVSAPGTPVLTRALCARSQEKHMAEIRRNGSKFQPFSWTLTETEMEHRHARYRQQHSGYTRLQPPR